MVLALGIAHSTQAAQAQRQVSDVTNELLRKNAETLHMASAETAKESERGIVDLETLKQTNAELIQTLDDVMRSTEGRQSKASGCRSGDGADGKRSESKASWKSRVKKKGLSHSRKFRKSCGSSLCFIINFSGGRLCIGNIQRL